MRHAGIATVALAVDVQKSSTLGQLVESRKVIMPLYVPTKPATVEAWSSISIELAKNASGDVRVVLGTKTRPQSIWEVYEFPALKDNPAVNKVIAIDPITGVESTIFSRSVR